VAWGCDGHRAIAILAERLLSASQLNALRSILQASPPDPTLEHFCPAVPTDVIAESSTWADDQRAEEPATAPWHFINFPRSSGAAPSNHTPFCPNGDCAIDAIVRQFRLLKTSTNPAVKANAVRYLLHFVGDVHQPLHTITNGDRGANCLPVTYYSQAPLEEENANFSPNLHGVWDTSTIRMLMNNQVLPDARALAGYLAQSQFPQSVAAVTPTAAIVKEWARDANRLARTVAYARLPVPVPIDAAAAMPLFSCEGNNQVSHRLANLHERVDATYELASVPAIERQLRLAARRLAAVLKAALP
jgi:hypothetical protein